MEKDSNKNRKIHKNVGKFKSSIEQKVKYEIWKKENRLKRALTPKEKADIRHKVAHDKRTQFAVRIGSLALVGVAAFSAGKMLGEGSGRIEGVTKEDNTITVNADANKFREEIKIPSQESNEGVLYVGETPIGREDIEHIQDQLNIVAQQEAQRAQIKEDVYNIKTKEDALEYMKKFYIEQYAEQTGSQINNISITFYNKDLNGNSIEEIEVKDGNGNIIDSLSGNENIAGVLKENYGAMMSLENLRKEYVKADGKDINEFLAKSGGVKEQVYNSIIDAKGLNEQVNQKVDDGR